MICYFLFHWFILEFGSNNYLELIIKTMKYLITYNSYSQTCGLQFETLFKIYFQFFHFQSSHLFISKLWFCNKAWHSLIFNVTRLSRLEGLKNYITICIADHLTGFYMLQIFTGRYFQTQAHVLESVFAWHDVLSVFKPIIDL